MAQVLTSRQRMNTARRQTSHFNLRERSLSHRDPSKGMAQTHQFAAGTTPVATGTVFPNRGRPVTFATTIEITGSPLGLVFEFGDSTNGVKLALSADQVLLAAGASAAGQLGIDGALSGLQTIAVERRRLVAAINPGAGKARVWVNGDLLLRLDNSPSQILLNGEWASGADGSVGAAEAGTSNTRIAITTAPSNFTLVAPLEVFMGQVPRQFD